MAGEASYLGRGYVDRLAASRAVTSHWFIRAVLHRYLVRLMPVRYAIRWLSVLGAHRPGRKAVEASP